MLTLTSLEEATSQLKAFGEKRDLGPFAYTEGDAKAAFQLSAAESTRYVRLYNEVHQAMARAGFNNPGWGTIVSGTASFGAVLIGAVTFNPILFGMGVIGSFRLMHNNNQKESNFIRGLVINNPEARVLLDFEEAKASFTARNGLGSLYDDCAWNNFYQDKINWSDKVMPDRGMITFIAGPPPEPAPTAYC